MSADEEANTQEEMPIVSPVWKKRRMQEDKTCTSSSYILTSEQLSLLVRLDESYSSDGRARRKGATIETQLRTSFAELDVKRSSLRDICSRAREAEKRAKKQSKQDAKSMEDLDAQLKNWKRKTELANALLKTEKEMNEFLREALNQE
ncbi:hypothetical protein V7S43_003148 [Phytophthora oleae]|uniref:Uncharacterized protein n=1 Tax=Phytophthora oleae TaxID=2107226 RepID=A0ABD3FZY1_9STRA